MPVLRGWDYRTAELRTLGSIPMVLSTAPGAEVWRPLATVIIGGLVTAALLTLFVLPVDYGAMGDCEPQS